MGTDNLVQDLEEALLTADASWLPADDHAQDDVEYDDTMSDESVDLTTVDALQTKLMDITMDWEELTLVD